MSLTTAALEVLVAKGLSAADILDVSRAMDVRSDPTAADRKRRQREREAEARDPANRDMSQRDVTRDTPPSLDKNPQTPKINPTPPTPTRESRAREAFPRPDWAEPQVWSDFLANRRRKSLSNTSTAHRKLLADIERLTDDAWPPGRILEAAVARGWGAIYASVKDEDDGRRSGRTDGMGRPGRNGGSASGMGRTVDALADWVSGAEH